MRLATITLFGMIMMCPVPGYSQSALSVSYTHLTLPTTPYV